MSYCSEMDWNTKWDCENFAAFCSKPIDSPKKLRLADWMIVDDGEIDAGSFNISWGGGNSGAASDGGHGSSAKSSASASTDSSTKDSFRLMKFECFNGNICQKMDMKGAEVSGISPPMGASVGSAEPLIGLRLGKRTYFENSVGGGNCKITSLSSMPTRSSNAPTPKKTKYSGLNAPIPRCQVEDCNLDLSLAKEYHQKHRVCEIHSKCPKVYVGGHERRFCQQCSRFHSLSEFDEKKRSCRRRLSDHNARRRKPQQEAVRFDPTRLTSPFYGTERRQHASFLLNNATYIQPRIPSYSMGDSSEFTITKGFDSKSLGDGDSDEPHGNVSTGFLASKNSTSGFSNSGSKITSHTDAAREYHHALSLLSSNSWGSGEPEAISLSSPEFWMTGLHPRVPTNNYFQEIALVKSPYEADFYSNVLN